MGKPNGYSNRHHQRCGTPGMIPLSDLFADHQEFHSDLQMDSFITLRSGGTRYGCYKQALRELTTRKLALIQRYANRDRIVLEIDELHGDCLDPFQARRNAIDAREKSLMLAECDRVIDDTEREFVRFYQQAAAIREALSAQGVKFPLDGETRYRLDCEMWEHQLKCMAAVDFMTCGRLGAQTVGLLQSSPVDMRRRIADDVLHSERHPELIEWFLSYDLPMPTPAQIEAPDVQKLLECSAL
jgi:hypothetical protein